MLTVSEWITQTYLSFSTGPTGPQGPTGATGYAGTNSSGVQGVTGPTGQRGQSGPAGPSGLTGPTGPRGPTGPTGQKGSTGATGLTGIQGPSGVSEVPSGTIFGFAGSTLPSGWLWCDGSLISRSTYSNLFSAIGETYDPGDHVTTFGIPNLKTRFPIGANAATATYGTVNLNFNLGKTGGEEGHSTTVSELFPHTHAYSDSKANVGSGLYGGSYWNPADVSRVTNNANGGATGATRNNTPKYLAVNYIIKI